MAFTKERECEIRAAGMVQAVIASGADPSEWEERTRYGLRLAMAFAHRLNGKKAAMPDIPKGLANG
jgi:hypothetical protein